MALISLPETITPNSVTPFLRDFGGVLTPFLGADEIRLNRLGLRLGGRFIIPPKLYRTDGMKLIARLMQAKTQRLMIRWPQPGLVVGPIGTPKVKVALSNGGTTLQIKGLLAGTTIREGQALSIVRLADLRRTTHMFAADGVADGVGDFVASLWPPMRSAFAVNDVIEMGPPMLEGHVLPGEELSWTISVDKMLDVSFSVVESR